MWPEAGRIGRLTRRRLLCSVPLSLAAARGAFASGQQLQTHLPPTIAPRAKGPLVFLDYDQAELDAAYDQALWAPNRAEVAKRNAQKNALAAARLGPPRLLAYGPTEIEKLHLYAADRTGAPIHIWIHGGAWRTGSASAAAFMAEMFVDAGAHFVAIDFNDVLETRGDLRVLADQVRRAVAWVFRHAESFGGDSQRIYISGHSSGGHLAAVVLTTDWRKDFGVPENVVKGALCASGMYDLHPVSLSARNRYVTFNSEVIAALSPMRHLDRLVAPVMVAHGTLETPEFQRQSGEFAAALTAARKAVTPIVLEGCNHFEVLESLGNPYGVLGRALLEQMGLRPASAA